MFVNWKNISALGARRENSQITTSTPLDYSYRAAFDDEDIQPPKSNEEEPQLNYFDDANVIDINKLVINELIKGDPLYTQRCKIYLATTTPSILSTTWSAAGHRDPYMALHNSLAFVGAPIHHHHSYG